MGDAKNWFCGRRRLAMAITLEQISMDEASVRYAVTMQYKIGYINVLGHERLAMDFLDGRGWCVVDITPLLLSMMEQAAKSQSPKDCG